MAARNGTYRFLEHTADALAECRAKSLPFLLEAATGALYAIALTARRDEQTQTRHLSVSGESREDVLIRWLQELIFLLDSERFVAVRCRFDQVTSSIVDAHVSGYCCRAEERQTEVKAATYHDMAITEEGGQWVARVVFDL